MIRKLRAFYHRWEAERLNNSASLAQVNLDEDTKVEQLRIEMLTVRSLWHTSRANEINPPRKSI